MTPTSSFQIELLCNMKYRIYSHISRKINDKIMPQKLGGRLISGSILAHRLDLLLRLSWNVIIAHGRRRSHLVQHAGRCRLRLCC